MASYVLPYGQSRLTATLPDRFPQDLIALDPQPAISDPLEAVNKALDNLVGNIRWSDFTTAKSAAIAINDKTRPVPHRFLLPPLLRKLLGLGLASDAITLFIATGAHQRMEPDEYHAILPPEVLAHYPVRCHDCDDTLNLINLGITSRGTPVMINREYMKADLRIVVGNIEPHQFQGFSGGVKSSAIGLAGRDTINHNHAMMTESAASIGRFDHNPARQDVEEIGRKIGVHLALNAILNEEKEIVQVLAGAPRSVMDTGIPMVRAICQVNVPWPYDLVIASPGGYPKDLNLYQAQKGLAHASLITRQGGTVVLVAACQEGSGSRAYEQWVQSLESNEAVLARFGREGFRVGPHKAYQIARDAVRVDLLLVSEMSPDYVERLLLRPVASVQEAVDRAIQHLPDRARIAIMPNANTTIPLVVD